MELADSKRIRYLWSHSWNHIVILLEKVRDDPSQAYFESRLAITRLAIVAKEIEPYLSCKNETTFREWHFLQKDQLPTLIQQLEAIRDRSGLGTRMTLDPTALNALDWIALNMVAIAKNLHRLTESTTSELEKVTNGKKPLTDNDAAILETMLSLDATSASPASREEILKAAKWDSEGKHAFDRLKRYGYVDAFKGVGFYLTESGIVEARKLGTRT